MAIDLEKYLTEQYKKTIDKGQTPGPVITISRQYGCAAKDLAQKLVAKLNEVIKEKKGAKEWTWINKEVFENTAKALNLKESRILHVFEGEKKGLVESIILSSSEKYYASDTKIKKKIIEIVRSFAEQGQMIIIGLGSVAITRDIKKSFHIRLHAPFEWRVEQAAKKRSRTIEEMKKYAASIDQKRDKLRDSFVSKGAPEELFDITFNMMTMSHDEIIDTIVSLMKKRKLI
ncbi:MAG: cytidylate kinase-like family protein [Chloroflexia bacterium]|nr:cytidylate kinase-like family protein [Chloroflexia bacterium]